MLHGSTMPPLSTPSGPGPSEGAVSPSGSVRSLAALPTPTALLDRDQLDRNIAQMQARADRLGVRLRPHAKTSKSVDVVRRQVVAGATGITVSTLKEAEQFFAAGIDDIVYAVGIAPNRFERALALIRAGCRLQLLTDDATIAAALAALRRRARAPVRPLHRDRQRRPPRRRRARLAGAGRARTRDRLEPGSPARRRAHACRRELRLPDTPRRCARWPSRSASDAWRRPRRLRADGLDCPVVSVGSTPTACAAEQLDGVTEVRAGVYVFFDLVMANIGVCAPRRHRAVGAGDGHRPPAREGLGDRRRRLDGDEPRPRHGTPAAATTATARSATSTAGRSPAPA